MDCQPFYINALGQWSYFAVVSIYYVLTFALLIYFKKTFRFARRRAFFACTAGSLLFLGFGLELLSGIFQTWTFIDGKFLFEIWIPIFGRWACHKIPLSEALWIAVSIPMFYYLYLWFTLVFHDLIYVMTAEGKFYKREDRWVGFFGTTKIAFRTKGNKGQENETTVRIRKPGILARLIAKVRKIELVERTGI